MSKISGIRDRLRLRKSVGRGGGKVDDSSSDLPTDHQLTFRRDADEEWKFKDGRIFINDMDVEELLGYETKDVRLWCGVSEAISEYKEMVRNLGCRGRSRFFSRAGAVQDKVLCNMKRLYGEKVQGIYLQFGDGELLMNNFNVRAFLAMYHLRPTEKARRFLLGLKSKLALILVSKNGTPQHERVHRVIQQLYEEVVDALGVPPIDIRRLPVSFRDNTV